MLQRTVEEALIQPILRLLSRELPMELEEKCLRKLVLDGKESEITLKV